MGHHAVLAATGAYVPETELSNEALIARLGEGYRATIEKLARASGITRRFVAPESWATSDLAVAAGRDALRRAGIAPEDLDLILVGTDSPDYVTPATSVIVQHELGARRAGTFDVGCACASFPTAIAAAAGMITSSPGIERVLVIGAYLMRRLADPHDPISFFYGDGAGAAVLVRSDEPGFLASAFRADGSYARRWMIASGGTVEPASEASVRAGRTHVRLLEPYPPSVNEEGWPAIVRELSERASLSIDDIDCFVLTQVRRGTIERVMETLGAPIEKAPMIMDRWGYTGSACIPMALHDAVTSGRVAVGDHVVLVGSGVGYNQAGVALRVTRELAGSVA